ncbi:MAG: L,D-transpeptidase [Ignavibacterium album]|uniref:L,D-transpeptidase n=1 Tax=Ignavibacterium album TaxID=591197 RepID=UPI0026EFB5DB|nr:L,D-transpeptidase [Ignavibacterium album]MCX8106059.1 L,D-transpeptidase [Ignavibacterium album]
MEQQNGQKKIFGFIDGILIRNIILTIVTIIIFLAGVLAYGILLNQREIPLNQAMLEKGFTELQDVSIIIDRKKFTLELYEGNVLIKSYRASFGRYLSDKKKLVNDGATPVGEYKVCEIIPQHKYYKFIKINYPNLEDASDALRKGIISQREFNKLKFEYYYGDCTSDDTALGGNIGIHGIGRLNFFFKNLPFVFNWTDGSIALSNEDIDEIISVIKIGTKIVIR